MHLRDQFLLDPDVVFLNHGSFGACPRPVLEKYQQWQRELEREPVEFLARRWDGLTAEVRGELGDYLGARGDDLVFVSNATTGMNVVAHSLRLGPEDEVLTTDLEYGAVDFTWDATGARIVRAPLESLWDHVTEATRVLSVSLSPPRRARSCRSPSCAGGRASWACSRWWTARTRRGMSRSTWLRWVLMPTLATHTSGSVRRRARGSSGPGPSFRSASTRSSSAGAGRKRSSRNGTSGRGRAIRPRSSPCRLRSSSSGSGAGTRCGRGATRSSSGSWRRSGLQAAATEFGQMVAVELPPCDPDDVQRRLFDEHRIEVPCFEHGGRSLLRISVQGYNDEEDIEKLVEAMRLDR